MPIVIVGAVAVVVVGLCLLLHYEVLRLMVPHSSRLKHRPRIRIGVAGAALFVTHLAEIWIFALGYFLLGHDDMGSIEGKVESLLDYVYFSAVTYATIGFGDMVPIGPIRFYAAMEALSGLFMITWSASFLFGLMHDFSSPSRR